MPAWLLRTALPAAALVLYAWSFRVDPVLEPAPEAAPAISTSAAAVQQTRHLADEADRLYRAGQYEAALAPLAALRTRTPNSDIVLRRLAKVYGHLDRKREEAEAWEQFMAVSPTAKNACPALPRAYEAMQQADRAFDAYERCYNLEREDPDLVLYFALACERRGDTARALRLYEEGVAIAPSYTDLRVGLARLSLKSGRLKVAAGAAAASVEAEPGNVDARLVAAQVALRRGRTSDARRHLMAALALNEGYADLHVLMAMVEQHDGHRAEALRHVNRALELDPADLEARSLRQALVEAK